MRIFLEFVPQQTEVHRRRLRYALSVFCAVYGHKPIYNLGEASAADAWITYATTNSHGFKTPRVRIGNLYNPRHPQEPAPPPHLFEQNGEKTVLHSFPIPGEQPDWLGEIFEWLSCADEYSIKGRDAWGRIDFGQSYCVRHDLNVRVPYAAIAMRFLQELLAGAVRGVTLEPPSPVKSVRHFIVNSHDVDILPAGYLRSLYRLTRHSLASYIVHRQPQAAVVQAAKAVRMALGGLNPLDQMKRILRRQIENKTGATYFFIAGNRHRKDANYRVEDPEVHKLMAEAIHHGMEIGLHGSYTSLDEEGRLSEEFGHLKNQGFDPRGNRQHWLRFTLDRLIPAVEQLGADYDSSLGWDCMGFRAGACFAFPPYHFAEERAATFLEIPLAIMDNSLMKPNRPREEWFDLAANLLSTSRKYGWGGISLLWHPTAFGASQLPAEIEEVYWSLMERRLEWNDCWVSAINFCDAVRKQYVEAGAMSHEYSEKLEIGSSSFVASGFSR
jgi:hypothetical protein